MDNPENMATLGTQESEWRHKMYSQRTTSTLPLIVNAQ